MNTQATTTNRSTFDPSAALNRRQFLGGTLIAAASAWSLPTLSGPAAESPPRASKAAEYNRKIKLGVDKARRFSTLSGYKQLFASGVEAVALETPP